MQDAALIRLWRNRAMETPSADTHRSRVEALGLVATRVLSALIVEFRNKVRVLIGNMILVVSTAPVVVMGVAEKALTRTKPHEAGFAVGRANLRVQRTSNTVAFPNMSTKFFHVVCFVPTMRTDLRVAMNPRRGVRVPNNTKQNKHKQTNKQTNEGAKQQLTTKQTNRQTKQSNKLEHRKKDRVQDNSKQRNR